MSKYQNRKEKIRKEAINWQANFPEQNYSWLDLAQWQDYFTKQDKRYGLLTEFRENGIC